MLSSGSTEEYVGCRTCPEEWKEIKLGFSETWNVPYATGALDYKLIPIRCPR